MHELRQPAQQPVGGTRTVLISPRKASGAQPTARELVSGSGAHPPSFPVTQSYETSTMWVSLDKEDGHEWETECAGLGVTAAERITLSPVLIFSRSALSVAAGQVQVWKSSASQERIGEKRGL